jgi:uncharacterized protein
MERIDKIINNEEFRRIVAETEELEKDRVFCHHDMDHFLDVARIATMIASDEDIDVPRDMIYAAALLHDIGRGEQYRSKTPHEEASARLAPAILADCDFSDEEIRNISEAIRQHGNEAVKDEPDLTGLLYRADKASRKCYMCKAVDQCHKKPEKRVMTIKY